MLGYVLEDDPDLVIAAINEAVMGEPALGTGHLLIARRSISQRVTHYDSEHWDRLRLLHHAIDLR